MCLLYLRKVYEGVPPVSFSVIVYTVLQILPISHTWLLNRDSKDKCFIIVLYT